MRGSLEHLAEAVMRVYRGLDRDVARFQLASGLRCPQGCSQCCQSDKVEATVLELLPMARALATARCDGEVIERLHGQELAGDPTCVLYRCGLQAAPNGGCSRYEFRPLVCRLFGMAAWHDKRGVPQLSLCRVIREHDPAAAARGQDLLQAGITPPAFQESFLQVASLAPHLGFRRYPINQALREALIRFDFQRPKPFKPRTAA